VDQVSDHPLPQRTALVVVASTRAAAGAYPDRSGPLLVAGLRELGLATADPVVVADGAPLAAALRAAVESGTDVVVTSGGTGLTPRDTTPEATAPLLTRQLPGVAEALRAAGTAAGVPTAALSRGLAGVAGTTLVVNVAGSTGAARDALAVLAPLLRHALDQIHGGDH
jgi:cyclic pyranopterin phosphate synthase